MIADTSVHGMVHGTLPGVVQRAVDDTLIGAIRKKVFCYKAYKPCMYRTKVVKLLKVVVTSLSKPMTLLGGPPWGYEDL
jgi:hypothetical protein